MIIERKINPLKEKLKKEKYVLGSCIYSFSPNIMEIAGYSGLDFCRIDNEHAWRQDDMLEHIIRAADKGNISPIARVDKNNPYLIRKVLEIGAIGFIIPDIKNKQERGFSNLCYSGNYGNSDTAEWIKWSNKNTLVGIMIETPEAIENLEEIMSVNGLDFILFGPADYSIRIGLDKPDKNHPKVVDAINKTLETADRFGKYCMIGVGSPWEEEAQKYIKMGFQMIELGHDYTILSTVWRNLVKEIKNY